MALRWLVAPRPAGLVDVGGTTSGPCPRFAGPAGRVGYQPLATARLVPLAMHGFTVLESRGEALSGAVVNGKMDGPRLAGKSIVMSRQRRGVAQLESD